MATLNFFNPASLLPSPDVAVSPPPQADNSAIFGALTDSMNQVRNVVKQKRELDELKKQAEGLASYVEPKSPELANYLRQKASTYNLASTNTAEEKSQLLNGTINLYKTELQERKIAKDDSILKVTNDFRYQLDASQKRLNSYMVAKQKWDKEQNDLYEAKERTRSALVAARRDPGQPYQRIPYPDQDKLDAADQANIQLTEKGPAEIEAWSRLGSVPLAGAPNISLTPGGSRSATQAATNAATPLTDFSGYNPNQGPDIPALPDVTADAPVNPEPDAALMPQGLAAVPPTNGGGTLPSGDIPAPAAVPSDSTPPSQPVPPAPPLVSPEPTTLSNAPLTPVRDALQIQYEQGREEDKRMAELAKNSADSLTRTVTMNERFFADDKTVSQLKERGEQVKKEIDAISGPDVPKDRLWDSQVKQILSDFETEIKAAPKKTAVQQEREEDANNRLTNFYYVTGGDTSKQFKVTKGIKAGREVYTAIDPATGREQDVTSKVNDGTYTMVNPVTSGVDVTSPNFHPVNRRVIDAFKNFVPQKQ